MEKMIRIPTNNEMELVDEYMDKQKFTKEDTKIEIISMFIVLITYGLDSQKALNSVRSFVDTMKNEYEAE